MQVVGVRGCGDSDNGPMPIRHHACRARAAAWLGPRPLTAGMPVVACVAAEMQTTAQCLSGDTLEVGRPR